MQVARAPVLLALDGPEATFLLSVVRAPDCPKPNIVSTACPLFDPAKCTQNYNPQIQEAVL